MPHCYRETLCVARGLCVDRSLSVRLHTPLFCRNGWTHPQTFFTPTFGLALATPFIFVFRTKRHSSPTGTSLTGASNARGMKKLRFSTNISLYLGNDTRYGHSYYEMRIGNRTRAMNGTIFNYIEWLSEIFSDTKHARSHCDSWASCYVTIVKLFAVTVSLYVHWQRHRCRRSTVCNKMQLNKPAILTAVALYIAILPNAVNETDCRFVIKSQHKISSVNFAFRSSRLSGADRCGHHCSATCRSSSGITDWWSAGVLSHCKPPTRRPTFRSSTKLCGPRIIFQIKSASLTALTTK